MKIYNMNKVLKNEFEKVPENVILHYDCLNLLSKVKTTSCRVYSVKI